MRCPRADLTGVKHPLMLLTHYRVTKDSGLGVRRRATLIIYAPFSFSAGAGDPARRTENGGFSVLASVGSDALRYLFYDPL